MTDEIESYRDDHEKDKEFRLRTAPRSLLSRGSIAVRKNVQDPNTGEWRTVIRMSRRKFDNDWAKETFLREYQRWGRMGESAAAAGVSPQTVRKAMEDDEDFAEAVMLAEEAYRDKLIGHHQDLLFNGTEKITYNKDGAIVGTERIYPIRLIELELKKHDKGYREKQELDITHKGGVLIAPAEMNSVDDWEKRFAQAKTVNEPSDEARLMSPPDEEDPF